MKRSRIIFQVPFDYLLEEFIRFSFQKFGEIKMKEISNKVNSSKGLNNYLYEAKKSGSQLIPDNLVGILHKVFYFVVSRSETLAIGSIFLLVKWRLVVDLPLSMENNFYLNLRLFQILDTCKSYKIKLNNDLNFFDEFYKLIETEYIINDETTHDKDEILFDDLLCRAIKVRKKTEFRTTIGLDLVNLIPDLWDIKQISNTGAYFYCRLINEMEIVPTPYHLGSKISFRSSKFVIDDQLIIKSINVQKFHEIDHYDACNEGMEIYEKEILNIWEENYEADAELSLFQKKWINENGSKNQWLWVFGIEHDDSYLAW